MTTESVPRPYDVWQMSFEYEDQPGVAKVRPVVIGAVDGGRAVVLAVKVTGHGPRPEFPGRGAPAWMEGRRAGQALGCQML